ncbi:exopolysaccharide biosynthesis polyprenyl glycosylphosphotransferase [Humibacillus xanthopallidus]|uniref:Exopolysaccharide biosynthesis polyprenyl glycosylphosphotransferase n=1 Tax=Humibacillus xanthopallidus TaxID=412689 RepID=A0A543PXJ8_9MICO|nr:sugar transferase [Humibacillus xanthopallidus]TQN48796.1 exopolysaccharide biosynthesis polyprenyl glycosylphosphotransferase [Humibacillus xanthopallidus]
MSESSSGALSHTISSISATRHRWAIVERLRLTVSDLVGALCATAVAQAMSLPDLGMDVVADRTTRVPTIPYWMLTVLVAISWTVVLGLNGSRDKRVLGSGTEEYRRILGATVWMLGGLGFVAYFLQYEVGRSYVVISLPLTLAALLATRWLWRRNLLARRALGRSSSRVLTIEDPSDIGRLAEHVSASPTSGLLVAGQVSVREREPLAENVARLAHQLDIDAVVVSSSANLSPAELSELMWALESVGADLILAPSLSGIAGPRVHTRPVEGLPLLYVQGPQYTGAMRTVKDLFDKVFSAMALVLLSPLFAVIAVAVKLTSPGPVFYRQIRVGLGGAEFRIWKFRSMADGADAHLQKLAEENGSLPPLIKIKNDKRVTSVGHFLRKWSLDELPQLINVLEGDMSLVGPRPQRPAEVSTYTATHARRLKTKPGMTGMWQVSGRSDVAWDDAVRMDLYYVENWSLSLDMVLIWRTIFAVLRGKGAY